MWLVKYLTPEGSFEFRRYKWRDEFQVRGIINGMWKRKRWQMVTMEKEY